ncbi:protein FAR1-RELATED SEQUENCE 5-like [Juglans microcarpa x Juglans regia]|uniref:protein FAR1-RELATED SEQUENCE 5-like n=1 Tax=Juglans microcarpa x Juglans regia TaxID=2249226 RepID=UPI001B7EB48F|nr:protein FAR1-RELATED SEQUENCE 5-like [Juglans microcarpa x Juglans regia]
MDFDMEHVDNEYDEVEVDDEQECAEIVDEPMVGMTFSSAEEVLSYYMKYGKQEGFGVYKRNSKQDDDGNIRWFTLVCVREGTSKSKAANILKPRQMEKIGCMARINVTMNDEGVYTLAKVNLEHTHICSPGKARHFKCFKKVDTRVAKRLEINEEARIRMSKNFKSLVIEAGGYDKLSFGEKECRNYINKARQLRLGVGGVEALYARSRAMYESFGDVITFDTTYLTNAYKMPFAPFVGVNHHGQSILFGCGLISNEDAHTFERLFKSWLKCMKDQPPSAIITDQDKAMQIAIARVFPASRHRFCLWHIMKKLPEKFGSHARYDEIKSALQKCVYDSLSEHKFEERWSDFLDMYDLHENAWLGSLYSDRHFWVPAYVRECQLHNGVKA